MISINFQKKLLGIFHDVYDDGFYLILPSPDVGIFHDVYDYDGSYLLPGFFMMFMTMMGFTFSFFPPQIASHC